MNKNFEKKGIKAIIKECQKQSQGTLSGVFWAYKGFPINDATVKTTWNSFNAVILRLNMVLALNIWSFYDLFDDLANKGKS